jgi:hypothetical protein
VSHGIERRGAGERAGKVIGPGVVTVALGIQQACTCEKLGDGEVAQPVQLEGGVEAPAGVVSGWGSLRWREGEGLGQRRVCLELLLSRVSKQVGQKEGGKKGTSCSAERKGRCWQG